MSQKQGNHSPKKVHGHGSGPAHQASVASKAANQLIVRKITNAAQEGGNKTKKAQSADKQKTSQTPEKQKTKVVTTGNSTASASSSTIGATPAPPKVTINYKPLKFNSLKSGDVVLALHHYVPDTCEVFHWMIYFHLGNGGYILHALLFQVSDNPDDPFCWKFEAKSHTLDTPKLAYARLLGNMSGLNATNFLNFAAVIKEKVPVPYIPRDESPTPRFSCSIWAANFIKHAKKEKYITLPYSVEQLRKEMLGKASSQAQKVMEKCKCTTTPRGTRYTFSGYKPLLEYMVANTVT